MEDWREGFSQESIDKAAKFGDILPQLSLPEIEPGKTNSSETLYVKFVSNPEKKENPKLPKGSAWVAKVEHQGATKQIFVPNSLRFGLAKECKIHGLEGPDGHYFVIGAHIDKSDYSSATKFYWCQYKPKHVADQEAYEKRQRESLDEIANEQQEDKDAEAFLDEDEKKILDGKPPQDDSPDIGSRGEPVDRKKLMEHFRKNGEAFTQDEMVEVIRTSGVSEKKAKELFIDVEKEGLIFQMSPGLWKCT